ncbi:MAG: sugar ABC transporter permease [Clostridiales bacterium]|nr:sugar ABC transporter permease [Clostridiales bacterium]
MQKSRSPSIKRKRWRDTWKRCVRCKELYLFLLPGVVLVFIFNYIPMYGITMAFQNFSPGLGISGSPFAGLEHFKRMFSLPTFWDLIWNTMSLSLLSLAINFPLPIILGLLLNQIRSYRGKKIAQTITYMPHFISVVVIVGIINVLLSPSGGIYGGLCSALGIEPVNFLGKESAFRWIYVLSDAWQHTGWSSIIYIACLAGVDQSLYEAATVDGANRLDKIIHIDLPSLAPTMTILLILNAGSVLGVGFEKIFLMQNSTNIGVSEVLSTYVYKLGIQSGQYSFSTAIGLFNTLVNFIVLAVVNSISKRVSENSLW